MALYLANVSEMADFSFCCDFDEREGFLDLEEDFFFDFFLAPPRRVRIVFLQCAVGGVFMLLLLLLICGDNIGQTKVVSATFSCGSFGIRDGVENVVEEHPVIRDSIIRV